MKRRLSAVEARRRFGELLEGVYYRDDEVLIERAGRVMAALIPLERYDAIATSRERLWEAVERIHEANKGVPYEVIEREVAAAVKEARAARRKGPTARTG